MIPQTTNPPPDSPIAAARACRADFDLSGSLDAADLYQFVDCYLSGSPLADVNASGETTDADVIEYVNSWMLGCSGPLGQHDYGQPAKYADR